MPDRRGRNSEIDGMNVIASRHTIIAMMKRIIPWHTTSSFTSPIRAATNKLIPNGGVMNPIARFTTMIIPKWIGLSPSDVATGRRMGESTIMAGVVSMKQPTISNRMLIRIRMTTLLVEKFRIACVIIAGIC